MHINRFNVLFSRHYEKLDSALDVLPPNRFNVCACPAIDILPVEPDDSLDLILSKTLVFDYLIFTSQYAVAETFRHLLRLGLNAKQLSAMRICAVGPMISQQLNKCGVSAQMIPQKYTSLSLADLFPTVQPGSKTILYPSGTRSLGILESMLTKKGYRVVAPVVYQTILRNSLDMSAQALIQAQQVDCFAFTSPSSVTAIASILGAEGSKTSLKNAVISVIGPTTQKACIDAGLKVDICPTEYTVQGMARAISHFYANKTKRIH